MKANRKFIEDGEAVSAVIGVILMVAITVAIAATVYVYVSGMLGGGTDISPTVTLQQSGGSILVSKVQNGPVNNDSASVSVVNKTSGTFEGSGIIYAGDDGEVNGGDTIVLDVPGESGQQYTVQLIYADDVIGTCTYIVQ